MIEQIKNSLIEIVKSLIENPEVVEISAKGKQDIVTNLDFQMERRIKEAIMKAFPEDHFIGEEENHSELTNQRTWVCDPIDGTLNFTCDIPYYGVQVALLENKLPILSIIYLPALGEMYLAESGKGMLHYHLQTKAYRKVDTALSHADKTLSEVIVSFGDFSKSNPSSRGFQLKAMEILAEKAMRVRIQGASSVDFAFVGAGKNGCHIVFSSNVWELAPGLLIAEEAGCIVGTIEGSAHGFNGKGIIVAANEHILEEVLKHLGEIN